MVVCRPLAIAYRERRAGVIPASALDLTHPASMHDGLAVGLGGGMRCLACPRPYPPCRAPRCAGRQPPMPSWHRGAPPGSAGVPAVVFPQLDARAADAACVHGASQGMSRDSRWVPPVIPLSESSAFLQISRVLGLYYHVRKKRDERAGRASVARVGRGHRGELKEVCRRIFGASA